MSRSILQTIVHAFRRVALPLTWYYVVTLAIPIANGAAQAGAVFVRHALVVIVAPPVLIVLAGAGYDAVRWLARGRRRTGSPASAV